jgi:hypothetical protein
MFQYSLAQTDSAMPCVSIGLGILERRYAGITFCRARAGHVRASPTKQDIDPLFLLLRVKNSRCSIILTQRQLFGIDAIEFSLSQLHSHLLSVSIRDYGNVSCGENHQQRSLDSAAFDHDFERGSGPEHAEGSSSQAALSPASISALSYFKHGRTKDDDDGNA